MNMHMIRAGLIAVVALAAPLPAQPATGPLTQIAQFDHQVTGAAVTAGGRRFVNFPRWTDDAPISVAEVLKDGSLRPYPDARWNEWRNARANELSSQTVSSASSLSYRTATATCGC